MERRFVFTGKQQMAVESFEPGEPGQGMVKVRSICSLMSTGTENIVFNRNFAPGTHWDNWVKYPFYPGYAVVGRVEKTGPGVDGVKPGDVVALRRGHASCHLVPEADCHPVPAGLPPEKAVWFAIGKICFMGARAAGYFLGDRVLIIGGGPIGQMSVRWAWAAGAANIILADGYKERLALALKGGATTVIGRPVEEAREEILAANQGRLPDIVIDTTGHAGVFATALTLAADRGRVIVLGDPGNPGDQRLTKDVITRGLRIIGAHDGHEDQVWDGPRIFQLFFTLAVGNRINLDNLNTNVFRPDQALEAYETANTRRAETMGILFHWGD